MTKEQTKAYIQSLLHEREHYAIHGPEEQLKAVDAELERVGYKAKPPAKRATKMQAKKG